MEFYYLVMCMLYSLKSDEMRKIKVLKCELKKSKNKYDLKKELRYQKCSITLINKIIHRINNIAKKADLEDDFKAKEENEEFEEI